MRAYVSTYLLGLKITIASLLLSGTAAAQSASKASSEQEDVTELAKKLENPISDLISVPFQNNTNFHYGGHNDTQNILNIQPVIPFHVSEHWNVITRTVLLLISQPPLQPGSGSTFGTGPTTFSAFLSPNKTFDGWLWGCGPIVQLPTSISGKLGSNAWGGGPTAVAVRTDGPFVYGGLINNVWSFGGSSGRKGRDYSTFLVQPIFAYNFGRRWSIASVPIITANWRQQVRSGRCRSAARLDASSDCLTSCQ
jgi:hypothetical protein